MPLYRGSRGRFRLHVCSTKPAASALYVQVGDDEISTDTSGYFPAHWLAIEGVQPAVPQNPAPAEAARLSEATPKGSSQTSSLVATIGNSENVTVKPLVKHILSKELQLYFERVCTAALDDTNESLRIAALASLRNDPGLHQLLPYFLQFIAEKVTHNLRNLFILNQMMEITHALLENESLFIDPYVSSIVPPVLTCLVGKRLGSDPNSPQPFQLRDFAASLIKLICQRFGDSSHTLRPRLSRTCLKHFLDPAKPLGTHYGAISGLAAIGGKEAVRILVLPNLDMYNHVLEKAHSEGHIREVDMVVSSIIRALELMEADQVNGVDGAVQMGEETKAKLKKVTGEIVADRLWRQGKEKIIRAVITADMTLAPL